MRWVGGAPFGEVDWGFSLFNVVQSCQTMYFIFTVCFYVGMPSRLFYFFCFTAMQVIWLGHTIKRGKVFAHLKSLKADIMFLQETHIKATAERRLRANWISQVYQSPLSFKARGVTVLFRKNIQFQLASMVTDPNGRYIVITGNMYSVPVTLLNIWSKY